MGGMFISLGMHFCALLCSGCVCMYVPALSQLQLQLTSCTLDCSYIGSLQVIPVCAPELPTELHAHCWSWSEYWALVSWIELLVLHVFLLHCDWRWSSKRPSADMHVTAMIFSIFGNWFEITACMLSHGHENWNWIVLAALSVAVNVCQL